MAMSAEYVKIWSPSLVMVSDVSKGVKNFRVGRKPIKKENIYYLKSQMT